MASTPTLAPPDCGIIPGSAAKLFICSNPDAIDPAPLVWLEIKDLDNYSLTTDATDTSLNTAGWIRSLPMERGMTITATGRVNASDPGQIAVDETALLTGCDALAYYRFVIPGPSATDEPYLDWGFWAWGNKQDVAAASTDPFSWGVELRLWSPPDELVDGQPVAMGTESLPPEQQAPPAMPARASASAPPRATAPHPRASADQPSTTAAA